MGKVVKVVIGISQIVAGVLTGNIYLIAQGVMMTASALMSPSGKQQARQADVLTLTIGESPREALFGEALTGGGMMDAFNWGGKYGTDWEAVVILLADHKCDALVGFYVNDTYYTFTGNGAVAGFEGNLFVKWYDGSEDQGVGDDMLNFGGYTLADNFGGCSYVLASYRADKSDAKHPMWSAGRPRFSWLVRGKRCYIARKDSTVGGSGSHRWNDPTTWEWTDNPIDCRYNWARGIFACDRVDQPDQLLIGRGLSAIEAPPENTFWRANICDEAVALAGGGSEKRYTIGTVIKADDEFIATEEMFAAACAGVITQPEGSVEIEPGHAKAPVAYITDDDILTGSTVTFTDFRSEADEEWVNTVIPRYIEPSQKWADHGAPIRRDYVDVLADKGPREATLSLIGVTSGTQAQRCGEIRRRMGRLLCTGSKTLGPRFAGLEEGDWIVYTSQRRTKGVPITLRIEAFSLEEKWQNSIVERQIAASVFTWSTADEIAPGAVAVQQIPPTLGGAPDPGDWILTGTTITAAGGTIPALLLSGSLNDEYATSALVEVRQVAILMNEDGTPILTEDEEYILGEADPSAWTTEASLPPGTTTRAISNGIAPGQAYQVSIRYVVRDTISDPLILGPVVAGSLELPRSAHLIRSQTVPFPISSDDTSISILAFWATLDDSRTIILPAGSLPGLTSATSYGVFWSMATSTYMATPYPSLAEWASRDNVFLRWQSTSNGGVFVPGDPAPPGDGGDGNNCVADDTMILVAEGEEQAASALAAGDFVYTQHERTLEWGAYLISAISFVEDDVWRADGFPRATGGHRFLIDNRWVRMDAIGVPDGRAMVAKITVAEAHTYVSAGVLSHNIKERA